MPWLFSFLIGLAFMALSYLIMPKPKQAKPEAAKEMDEPTAEAGRPMPVVFGTMLVKSPNILWYGDKAIGEFQVDA